MALWNLPKPDAAERPQRVADVLRVALLPLGEERVGKLAEKRLGRGGLGDGGAA